MSQAGAEDRRLNAVLSGYRSLEADARAALGDPDRRVRSAGLRALVQMDRVTDQDLCTALADPDPRARRQAGELIGETRVGGVPIVATLTTLLDDPDATVIEVVAWALGELCSQSSATKRKPAEQATAALARTAVSHPDALCREAAVASLGAIGRPEGLPAILAAMRDKPAIRRRAILALAAFEGPEVDEAIRHALTDRDWQVRQSAEDLTSPRTPTGE